MNDPLAGYRPDWRNHLPEDDPLAGYNPSWRDALLPRYAAAAPAEIQAVATPSGAPPEIDPLAGYVPDWRQQTAAAMFGPPEQPSALAPELEAGIRGSAGAGVTETPFQNAYRSLARVGRQAAASLPEQAALGAEALARTGALISRAPIDVWGQGGEIQQAMEPVRKGISAIAGGEPRGVAETAARMVGPAPLWGLGKGIASRFARNAAEEAAQAAEMETMGRIHGAPLVGDEVAAHRFDQALSEPRTPNTEAVTSFDEAYSQLQAEKAADEAKRLARINQPQSEIGKALARFDEEVAAAQARQAVSPTEIPKSEPPAQMPEQSPVSPLELGDAFEDPLAGYTPDWREPSPTGAPDWLPDPLAHVPAAAGPTEVRNPKYAKLDVDALLARRHQLIDRMDRANEDIGAGTSQWTREDPNAVFHQGEEHLKRSGTIVTNRAGRGIGRLKQDGGLLEEVDQELRVRGVPDEEVAAAYDQHYEASRATSPPADETLRPTGASGARILGGMTVGGAAGAVAGGTQGDTPEERARNALIGLGVGMAGGGLAGQMRRLGPIERELAEIGNRRGAVGARRIPTGPEPRPPLSLKRVPDINPDEYVNVEKFALDETGEQRLRQEVTRVVQEQGLHPKQAISWDETRRLAQDIGLGDLPKEQINTRLNGPQMLAIRNIVSTNIEALEKLYGRLQTPLDDLEKARVDRSIGYLERENDALLGRFTRARTQTGRDLNNLKILANRVMDPFTWIAKAANLTEQAGKKLLPEQRDRILELIRSGDKPELINFVASLRPVSRLDQAVSLWKTGLLTNPKTHLANILGNTAMAGLETAKDLPAALTDRILSLATGQRAKSFSVTGTAQATWRGAKAGAQEAGAILRHGIPADLTRWELPQEVTFKNPVLRAYTQMIRRGLAAPDAFFRKVALHRSLAEAERLGPMTEETALQAVADAEYAVFQNQSRLARAGQGLREPLGAVGHIIAPFTRTPGNVISATLDYSPFGAIRGGRDIYRLIKAVKAQASPSELRALQKAASESVGRTVTGTGAAFLGGYILARAGRMTGARPMKSEQQDQWDLAGKQENAIRIGKHWLSLNRLSPIGNLMALGANYYVLSQNPEAGPIGAAAGALGSIGTTVSEQSFLKGVQDIKKAIDDPVGQAGQYAKNLVASVIPAAVGAIARGADPVIRDTKGGFFDTFMSRIPGESRKLPAQVDALGREKRRSGGVMGQLFDPTTAREYKLDDPVISELERTGATLGELNMGRARPAEARKLEALIRTTRSPTTKALLQRRLDRAGQGEQRPEFLIRSKAEGQVLNKVLQRVLADQNYQRLPLEARGEVLEAVIAKFRRDMGQLRRKVGR